VAYTVRYKRAAAAEVGIAISRYAQPEIDQAAAFVKDLERTESHLRTQPAYVPGGGYTNSSDAEHLALGQDRRLATVAIVDCPALTGGVHTPVRGYACILLLDPYDKVPGGGNNVISKFEFLGLSNTPGNPCASSGVTGNATSQGPMVPSLVQ